MTAAKSWGLGASIGLLCLLLAHLAGANVMDWHHVHRVPCQCPAAAREFLLMGAQASQGSGFGDESMLFAAFPEVDRTP